MYLLFVDNNHLSPRDIKDLLDKGNINCEVVSSSSSTALLDLNKKIMPKLIMVDFSLFEDHPPLFIRNLRRENPESHIIAFLDPDQYTELDEAVEEGLDDYLIKPLQSQDLMVRIKMGLRKKDLADRATAFSQDQSLDKPAQPEFSEIESTVVVEDSNEKGFGNIRYFNRVADAKEACKAGTAGLESRADDGSGSMGYPEDKLDNEYGEYKNIFAQARVIAPYDPDEAVKIFERAFQCYSSKNLLSPDEGDSAERAGEDENFMESTLELVGLLKDHLANAQIIRICEKALEINYYEEAIHKEIIEAMIAEGMNVRARIHYEAITSTLYLEMGVKPSFDLKQIMDGGNLAESELELDLSAIQNGLLSGELNEGALLCDTEQFRYSYKLEQLRCERNGQSILLCLIMLITEEYTKPPAHILEEIMPRLQAVIIASLRKGDLVTRWSDGQFLLLLPGLNREEAGGVMDRIEHHYLAQNTLQGLRLQKKVENILPLEGDSHFN